MIHYLTILSSELSSSISTGQVVGYRMPILQYESIHIQYLGDRCQLIAHISVYSVKEKGIVHFEMTGHGCFGGRKHRRSETEAGD